MLRVLKGLEQPYPPRFGRGSLGSAEEIRHSLIALVSAIGLSVCGCSQLLGERHYR